MYKGQLEGFPREIVDRMLECQVEQGNPKNVSIFERMPDADKGMKGFNWRDTIEGGNWWSKVIDDINFDTFFEKYPKTSYPKVMMVGNYYPLIHTRVVFMEKCGKFIAWEKAQTLKDAENEFNTCAWKYAEDIKPENPQKQELLTKAEELIHKAEELKAAANKL